MSDKKTRVEKHCDKTLDLEEHIKYMLEELEKIKEQLLAFKKAHDREADYPEDVYIALEEALYDAQYHIKNFDWEQHSIDLNEGAEIDAADFR